MKHQIQILIFKWQKQTYSCNLTNQSQLLGISKYERVIFNFFFPNLSVERTPRHPYMLNLVKKLIKYQKYVHAHEQCDYYSDSCAGLPWLDAKNSPKPCYQCPPQPNREEKM